MDYVSFSNFDYGDTDDYPREAHIMPTPSGSPWNVQGMSWGSHSPPQLVQFNAEVPAQPRFTSIMHCKRKSLEPEPRIPAKIHITEDKMAAHLHGLHLSNDYTTHALAINENMDINMDPPPETANNFKEKLKGHTIVLSEEIRKLREEPLIPPSLMEMLEKPCMSIVLWHPKENADVKKEENKDEEEPKKRNGVLVPDMGMGMDVEM